MEVHVEYLGGKKFEASARGHTVVCDQPVETGGGDEGMAPPEFLLTSLATCAGFYAAEYLNTRGLPSSGLSVNVGAEKVPQPARLGSFHIDVFAPGLDSCQEAGVLRAVKACLIHNTLVGNPRIDIAVNSHPLPSEAEQTLGAASRN